MQAVAATAIPGRPRYSGDGPRRKLSASVLVLWVGFLLLNYLQPCCEALAESISHRHDHSHSVAADARARGAGANQIGVHGVHETLHEHCGSSDGVDTSLPDFLNASSSESGGELKFLVAASISLFLYRFFSHIPSSQVGDHERGPPDRVYLTTQRLRI